MSDLPTPPSRLPWWLALLVFLLSAGAFLIDGNVGISFADEGYLWYGVEALKAGSVPMRDFHAYDPGRYLWLAGTSYLLGDGLVSLRIGCVLFAGLGLWCGLLAASRISRDWRLLLLVGLTLALWMVPRFKVFEQAIALIAIYVAVRLIERPTLRQHWLAGVFVGGMAFMGRNHGVYLAAAFGMLLLVLARSEWSRLPARMVAWVTGVLIGYLPQWLMFAFVPGYFTAFLGQLRIDLAAGTNLATRIPWPWRVPGSIVGLERWGALAEGCFYLALPLGIAIAVGALLRLPRGAALRHPVLLAAVAVALPYAHHTFSRADYVHLAHCAPAFVVSMIALAAAISARPWMPAAFSGAFLLASATAMIPKSALVAELSEPTGTFVPMKIRGETMHVHLYSAVVLRLADHVANRLARADEPVVFLPHWPGLYPVTERRSPLHQIYFILPASEAEEEATLAAMEARHVAWVVLKDYRLDGRDDLRFQHTNPRTFAYLQRHFRRVEVPGFATVATVLQRIEPPVTAAH